jgi:hypothetical protein
MIMFGSFLPSLLVGFRTTNFTRTSEPTLSWNQLHSLTPMFSLFWLKKERAEISSNLWKTESHRKSVSE